MEVDPQGSKLIEHVAKRELHFDLITLRSREEIISHGQPRGFIENEFGVFKPNLCPALDGKASVFWARIVRGDKIRECLLKGWPELLNDCKGWLEQNRAQTIGVECFNVVSSDFNIIGPLLVR